MQVVPTTRVEKKVKDGVAYYTVFWSSIKQVDKYDIQRTVPAMAGIFELFYRGDDRKLHLFYYGKAWLGGLRAVIREMTDPILMKDRPDIQDILKKHECYYRFAVCESREDMEDLIGFFARTSGTPQPAASGRYKDVRLKEIEGQGRL
ncbi:MAG TPA: hypothetical protein PLG79_07360 [Spirochaetales bacterium]|nr:hypothetical protein [Spirochaetales bacterium]HOV38520.1 hypothetical protein [Spirochaetales bacterium]